MHNFGGGGGGGRSDLFNSAVKRGKGYFQNSGGSWLKGELKNSWGGGGGGLEPG